MRSKMVLTIFKKEMIDILRDKKTLFMGIVLPLILYPVLMIVMTQIMSMTMNGQDSKDINIAFEKSPPKELRVLMERYGDKKEDNFNIVKSKDYKKDLDEEKIDAYIEVKEKNNIENYKIYINSSKENSLNVENKLENIFDTYKDEKVKSNIEKLNMDVNKTLEPIVFS